MRLVGFALLVALATPAAAERLVVTGSANFSLGTMDVGPHEGFMAPGGHFDLGASFKNFRVQGELDTAMWNYENAPQDSIQTSGSFFRLGWALRYYFMNVDVRRRDQKAPSLIRLYVEGGAGQHWIHSPLVDVARTDVAIGFGAATELGLGPVKFGGNFGIRALVTEAPRPDAICHGPCDLPAYRKHDIAIMFLVGILVGR